MNPGRNNPGINQKLRKPCNAQKNYIFGMMIDSLHVSILNCVRVCNGTTKYEL